MKPKKTIKTKIIQLIIAVLVVAFFITSFYLIFGKDSNSKSGPKPGQTSKSSQQKSKPTDAERFKKEYKDVSVDNRFVYASDEEITTIFKDGTGLIFLGFPECPWCQSLSGLTDKAAKNQDLDKIYYLDIREHRQNNTETYQTLVAKLEPYLDKDDQGEPTIFVPDVTAVKNGKIVGRYEMEEGSEAEMAGGQASYWTTERKARTVKNLEAMIQKIK